jgi:ribosomal protein L4
LNAVVVVVVVVVVDVVVADYLNLDKKACQQSLLKFDVHVAVVEVAETAENWLDMSKTSYSQ